LNRATLIGNLTRDPEVRMTNGGISVCTFSVAVQRRFANAQGERQADFFNVVAWRALADNCGRYLKKGSKVFVAGPLQNRTYEAQDGNKRYVTEIVADEVEFLDRAPGTQSGEPRADTPSVHSEPFGSASGFGDAIEDEELPF
jgi:single-strand DNA-binding protein